MRRSFGVTLSAVIVFLGCALDLLVCGIFVLGLVALNSAPPEEMRKMPHFAVAFGVFGVVLMLGCAGWGVATGVELLRLRPWARISMLMFGGLLLFVTIPGMLMFLFMPSNVFSQPGLPEGFALFMRIWLVVVYGSVGGLGGVWLWFFSRRAVRNQFHSPAARPFDPQAVNEPGHFPLPAGSAHAAGRPVGVTIIAIYLLFSGVVSLFLWPLYRVVFPELRPYATFLGLIVRDFPAVLLTTVTGGVTAAAGWGLLKLRSWARVVTIWLQVILFANIAILMVVPAARAQFTAILEEYREATLRSLPAPNVPVPNMNFTAWIGLATVFPIAAVIVWYLMSRKQAYLAAAERSGAGD